MRWGARNALLFQTAAEGGGGAEASPKAKPNRLGATLAILSNGFVLLVVGSLISSLLVPMYQRGVSARQTQLRLMEESHANFLQYENSIWEEYYAIFPLLHESSIDKATYIKYTTIQTDLKLKRYQLYATLRSLAVAFRNGSGAGSMAPSDVERRIESYAVEINSVSAKISAVMAALYCADARCWQADNTYGGREDRFELFNEITNQLQDAVKLGEDVAGLMVQEIRGK